MAGKVLKVAVSHGGKVLKQKVVPRSGQVTVGSAASNMLPVPGAGIAETYALFEVVSDKYCLNFTESMAGEIRVGDGRLDFDTAREQTGVRKRGSEFQMVLSENSTGRVELGDGVKVLFQFVDPPPASQAVQLPAESYTPVVQRLDNFFWGVLLVSAILHVGGVVVLYKQPKAPVLKLTQIPDRFAKLIIKKKPKVEPPKPKKVEDKGDKKTDKKKPAVKKADKKAKPKPKKRAKPKSAADRAQRVAAGRKAARNTAMFKALSIATRGESGAGAVFQDNTDPRTNVSAALGAAGGSIAMADGKPGGNTRGGSAGGGPIGVGEVGNVKVGSGSGKPAKRRGPKISFSMRSTRPDIEDGALDPSSVARRIRRKKRAFQSCYERELKRNPSLKGKLVLEVTVGGNGRVNDVSVDSNGLNNQVANCIKSKMRSIRFPKPEGGEEATFTYPFIFASSN
jgi:outer membrane biosynthesis protein TonB